MITLFLFMMQAWAAEPTSLVRFYPAQVLRNETVEFRPIDGHHFSFEAPQSCGSGSLNEKNPRTIKCQFSQAGATQAVLNVCDDKKTYCRPLQLKVNVVQGDTVDAQVLKKNEHINKDLKKTMIAGFIEGTPQEVTAHALQIKQPVFVMVSTDWCPPCNESKEYLLPSESFKNATKDWYKVYVDGDSVAAADWEKPVPYHYFPSFVLLNSHMEEIGRFNGEIRQTEFAAWANEQEGYLDDPIAAVKSRVVARADGEWMQRLKDLWHGVSNEGLAKDDERLLRWALDQEDKALIAVLLPRGEFSKIRGQILTYKISELERMEAEQKKDFKSEKVRLYQLLLEDSFRKEHFSANLQSLCELDVVACKPYLSRIPDRLEFLTKEIGLQPAEKESQLGDEYYSITEIYRVLDEKSAQKDFASRCVEHFESMQKTSSLKISRSGYQGMVACLELAEFFPREEKALKALMEAYPSEPTFMWRMARMRRKEKKFDESITWINKAEALAYGYNWFSLQLLKAEVLLSQKKASEAKQVVEETLAQIHLDASTESRNQRLVARLRTLQSSADDVSKN